MTSNYNYNYNQITILLIIQFVPHIIGLTGIVVLFRSIRLVSILDKLSLRIVSFPCVFPF